MFKYEIDKPGKEIAESKNYHENKMTFVLKLLLQNMIGLLNRSAATKQNSLFVKRGLFRISLNNLIRLYDYMNEFMFVYYKYHLNLPCVHYHVSCTIGRTFQVREKIIIIPSTIVLNAPIRDIK